MAMAFALQWPRLVENLFVVDIAPVTYLPGKSSAVVGAVMKGLMGLDLSAVSSLKDADRLLQPAIPVSAATPLHWRVGCVCRTVPCGGVGVGVGTAAGRRLARFWPAKSCQRPRQAWEDEVAPELPRAEVVVHEADVLSWYDSPTVYQCVRSVCLVR